MNKKKYSIVSFICFVLVLFIVLVERFEFFETPNTKEFTVAGMSMYPTLSDGTSVQVISDVSYNDISIEDIILFRLDGDDNKYIKRVIAKSGDVVEIINNEVYVNGNIIEPVYSDENSPTTIIYENSWTVGEDEFFVLGDNYTNSKDSRHYGCIDMSNVIGCVKE